MAETQASDIVIPSGDVSVTRQHHQGPNGTGGKPGTHEGHADRVPMGLGMADSKSQSKGNHAAAGFRERDGASGAAPAQSSDFGDSGGNIGIT